jgi:diguanylate cyclase (GGDEF)-like protein/PAS domain S-box-containing protein
MKNWWRSLDLATKLNIPIQLMLAIVLSLAHIWVIQNFKAEVLDGAKRRAAVSADGIINGMNMLMVTGMISNPENRRLLIKKMSASERMKEVRIIRAKQVQDQFGKGLPEEQAMDDLDNLAIGSKQAQFKVNKSASSLRVVVPFIVSTNFRGTNCLSCHHVEPGSVNGAASITIDMTEDFGAIRKTRGELWAGQLLLQLLMYFATQRLIRRLIRPLTSLKSSMEVIKSTGSTAQFVPVKENMSQDEVGILTGTFNRMSEALFHSEQSMRLAQSIYESNADAIIVTDENNLITDVNPAFIRLTGYMPEEVIGKNPRIMKSGLHDEHFYRQMWQKINDEDHWQGEIWDKRRDGSLYAKLANIIALRNSDGSVYRYVAQFSDITEKKQKDELIHWQANYDPLTNLPNRRLFQDRLAAMIKLADRKKQAFSLFYIDLDRFKEINDTLGHANGDALLMETGQRITGCVRETDTVARLGGDEFAIILPELGDTIQIKRIAEEIVTQLARPFFFISDETGYHISASIGIAIYPSDAKDIMTLINCADHAMYQAKTAGRNGYKYFSESIKKSKD